MPQSALALLLIVGSAAPTLASSAPSKDASVPGNEIVVVAERLRAEVNSPAPIEASFDSAAIAGFGASSIADILAQLSALTGSAQARAGDGPVLLVNGRRIGSFEEVRNLPPEAIARVDVLPEEAALRLGYPATAKPVNIVLKPRYASATGELEDRVTTRGLRNDFNTELNLVDIAGDNRLTFDLQYQIGDAITEAKRGVIRPLDQRAASAAGLVSFPGSILAVPATGRTPGDFQTTIPADDTGAYRTLVPQTHQFTAAGALARALSGGRVLSVTARFDRLTADDGMGPGTTDVVIPIGSGNPFGQPVRLRRALPSLSLVERSTRTDTYHFGAQLAGFGRWQWSAAANYDRIGVDRTKRGSLAASALQAELDRGGMADPFGAAPAGLVTLAVPSAKRSRDQTVGIDLFASGALWRMPAGAANLALRATLSRETLQVDNDGLVQSLSRSRAGGQASLDIPLLPAASGIGRLDFNTNVALDRFSDVGTTRGYGAGLVWKPAKPVALLVAWTSDQTVPLMADRGAPTDVTGDALLFDYATGRSAAVARTDGGNPALRPDQRDIVKAELTLKPAGGVTLAGTFTHTVNRDPVLAFPGITPAVEQAIPALITRDSSGRVIAVDARPFNAVRDERQDLRLALNFSRTFRSQGAGPRVPGGGSFGGGHAFGASGSMIQFALSDTIRLRDRLTLADGAPALDLVGSTRLSEALRVPRHRIEAQVSATHHGFGLRANAGWFAGGLTGLGGINPLDFGGRSFLNFRLFWFPEKNGHLAAAAPWLHGVRLLLAVDNAFDSYQQVTDQTGATPLGFQRGIVDPLGRTFRLSIRKTLE